MRLVEQHTIKPSSVYYNELYDLLHKCKNLYNKGLYVVRQHYFQYKDDNTVKYKYLNYYSLERVLKIVNHIIIFNIDNQTNTKKESLRYILLFSVAEVIQSTSSSALLIRSLIPSYLLENIKTYLWSFI